MASQYPFDDLSGLELDPGVAPAAVPPGIRRVLPRTSLVVNGNAGLTQNVAAGRNAAPEGATETLYQTLARIRGNSDAAQRALNELRAKDIDTSALEDYGRRRAEGGQSALLNALAAQYAGDRFAGLQDAFLKESNAARSDVKLGQGLLTGAGKFIRDPYAQRESEEKRLSDQANYLEKQATALTGLITNREDRLAERDRRAAEFQQSQQLRRDLAGAARAGADATRAAAQDARIWQVEDRMADDYRQETKDASKVVSTYENLRKAPPTAAGDISFIFQYMKMLDPGSVVREGEFATAQNSGGVNDTVRNLYNRALNGQRLNPQQRAQFLDAAGALATNAQQSISAIQRRYSDTAKRRGVNPENIFGSGSGSGSVRVDY